jgi:hypothetical protein
VAVIGAMALLVGCGVQAGEPTPVEATGVASAALDRPGPRLELPGSGGGVTIGPVRGGGGGGAHVVRDCRPLLATCYAGCEDFTGEGDLYDNCRADCELEEVLCMLGGDFDGNPVPIDNGTSHN